MRKIILFDPSIRNEFFEPSINLGDLIIYESISKVLKSNFPRHEIIRISTHQEISNKQIRLIKGAEFSIVGGTNLLSSNLREYNQWKSNFKKNLFKLPVVNNAVLLGVGWWQYQSSPAKNTKKFYKRLLSNSFQHSVRDSYSHSMLNKTGVLNVLNTSCPTTWDLNELSVDNKIIDPKNVLLMLTDYHPNYDVDNEILKIVLSRVSNKIYFYPQGSGDLAYLKGSEIYKKNSDKFILLNHEHNEFDKFIKSEKDFIYIGSRLHGGIKCLQNGIYSLILANDNRAIEISKDINIPVIERDDFNAINLWLDGLSTFGRIKVPESNIDKWINQFK